MSNYDDLDIYNGDPEHDMWVDSTLSVILIYPERK